MSGSRDASDLTVAASGSGGDAPTSPQSPPGRIPAADIAISLVVAFNFAVTQPVLDLLGRNAPFFVAHDLGSAGIIGMALLLAAAIPLGLAGVPLLVRLRSPRLARMVHLALLAVLLTAFALPVTRSLLPLSDVALIGVATLLGAIGTLAYVRTRPLRLFMRFSLLGPVAFVLFFLFASPAAALIGGGSTASVGMMNIGRPAPVVLVMLDEFPLASIMDQQGNIDGTRYPNFARLSEQSTWFRNATTVHKSTTVALPSLLTGNVPRSLDTLPIAPDHPGNLFELLAHSYDIVANEPVSRFCVQDSCRALGGDGTVDHGDLRAMASDVAVIYGHLVLPPGLRTRLPEVDGQWAGFVGRRDVGEFPNDAGTDAPTGEDPSSERSELLAEQQSLLDEVPRADKLAPYEDFIGSLESRTESTLYFGHLMLPHAPWVHLPSGDRHTDDLRSSQGRVDAQTWGSDEWQVTHAYRRHLLQVEFTDRLLGRLLDRLEEQGMLEESLLIVLSDHGVTFQPGERHRSTSAEALGEVAYVPFFVKVPGQTDGDVSDDPTQIIDVLPTVLDVLEVDQQIATDGRSVFDAAAPRRTSFEIYTGTRGETHPADGTLLMEAVQRKYRLFPLAEDPDALFRFGPHGALVGEESAPLEASGAPGTVQIPEEELPTDVVPGSGLVPALVRGVVRLDEGQEAPPTFLALSLNGTVSAIAKTYLDDHGTARFETMLDPRFLQPGDNDLDVFVVSRGSRGTELSRMRLEGAP